MPLSSGPTPPHVVAEHKDAELGGASWTRRRALAWLAGLGVGTAAFQRALAAQMSRQDAPAEPTPEMIQQAEWVADLELSESDRQKMAVALRRSRQMQRRIRDQSLDNGLAPAVYFHAAPSELEAAPTWRGYVALERQVPPTRPDDDVELAYLSLAELSRLIRSRQVSSRELTQLYLNRLRRHDPLLHCVVNFTEPLALEQAQRADRELAAGRYRGPLHGVPWGAKDLIAYPGFPTTWGAVAYKDQVLTTKATVAERLDAAGAVLVAKLALGSIAMGDKWFGGMTRNPWNPQQGSSGSSAGSASATVAGLVGFALGSETLGSIVSPCRRCGVTGLRPTFGRVSRYGCMALAWSLDKIGPIARSVEDCALVLSAIHGRDGRDATAVTRPFNWPSRRPLRSLRVGFFDSDNDPDIRAAWEVLKKLGVQLMPIKLPEQNGWPLISTILNAESATAFDELLRRGNLEGLEAWTGTWRQGQFVTAVDYLRASRLRTELMRAMAQVMDQVDAYVGGNDLVLTNLTGHPTVVVPNGFEQSTDTADATRKVPKTLTFTGRLFGESELLSLAHAYQQTTGYHLQHPPLPEPPRMPAPALARPTASAPAVGRRRRRRGDAVRRLFRRRRGN